ncbi:MAG: ATP-binding protein [Candidatus Sericytochromatia bacterium]|nr:ATP-binding protein [Candidatus Sericytochromatia bacterium]
MPARVPRGRVLSVSLTGAPCVGKTTMARALAERFDLPLLPERSREVAREWGYTPANMPEDLRLPFQWAILDRQVAAEHEHETIGYISDRCPVDSLCHFEWFGPQYGWPEEEATRYREAVEERVMHYDLLVVIPPMFPIVDDGERITDPSFQRGFHAVLSHLVEQWEHRLGPRLHVVSEFSLEDRIAGVEAALGMSVLQPPVR